MNSICRIRSVAALTLLFTIYAPLVLAQEEAPVEDTGSRLGNIFVNLEAWVAQPTGLQYSPATSVSPDSPFESQTRSLSHGTHDEGRYQLEYTLPSDAGTFELSLYRHEIRRN